MSERTLDARLEWSGNDGRKKNVALDDDDDDDCWKEERNGKTKASK